MEPLYYPQRERGIGFVWTLAGLVLLIAVTVMTLDHFGVLGALLSGAPPQMTITTSNQPAARPEQPPIVRRPVSAPAQAAPAYDNAAYNATAAAVQEVPQPVPTDIPPLPTLVPEWHAPMAIPAAGVPDACTTWHAPLPWPAECGAQEGWHAPMVTRP